MSFLTHFQAHRFPEAERNAGKQQFEVSEPEVARPMAIKLNLQKRSVYYIYLIEQLHDAYTDNSGKKRSSVYDSTALTEICEKSASIAIM